MTQLMMTWFSLFQRRRRNRRTLSTTSTTSGTRSSGTVPLSPSSFLRTPSTLPTSVTHRDPSATKMTSWRQLVTSTVPTNVSVPRLRLFIYFLPLSPNRARRVLSSPAGRAGVRLSPLPLSRVQFLSDRGQTWWGRILGQDLGRVRSWETWLVNYALNKLINDFDLPSPLLLSRAEFLSDRGQTWWGRILEQDLGRVRSWEIWLVD